MSFTIDGLDYVLNLIGAREQILPEYYVALTATEPGLTVSGTELTEPTGMGYRRATMVNVSGNWDVIHNQLTNTVPVDYPLADEDWGSIRYWAVCDSVEAGRVLWSGEFTEEFYISEGDQIQIPENGMTMYFGDA